MKIKDLYLVPESAIDEKFIEDEIKFLLHLTIYDEAAARDHSEYERLVNTHYESWMFKNRRREECNGLHTTNR